MMFDNVFLIFFFHLSNYVYKCIYMYVRFYGCVVFILTCIFSSLYFQNLVNVVYILKYTFNWSFIKFEIYKRSVYDFSTKPVIISN